MTTQKEHERFTEIKTAMLVHVPFFSSLLFDMMDVRIGKFPEVFGPLANTAATDGKRIYIDEDFLKGLKLPEAVFLVCHEIGHAMWMHMSRAKHYHDMGFEGEKFDGRRWNHAGDYVINDMLVKSKIGEMPKCGLISPKYTHDMLVEDVYKDLKDKMPPAPPQIVIAIGAPGGQAQGDGNDGQTMDVHIHSPIELNEAEIKRAIQTAVNAAKAMDKMPAALERWATEFLKPQVDWVERLRYQITRCSARDSTTWSRPHRRRLVMQNMFMPANTGYGAGVVFIAVDTSGSIGKKELNTFLTECDDIIMNTRPTRVILAGCDCQMGTVIELQDGETLRGQKIDLGGGGGTSFEPPFEYIRDNDIEPSVMVYLTDMEGVFPKEAPPYPVIWCRTQHTKRHEAKFGEHIDIDFNR